MKTIFIKYRMGSTLVSILFAVMLFGACSSNDKDEFEEQLQAELSVEEQNSLMFMLEEEKMARDVYDFLFDKWQTPVFDNISNSEQNHLSSVSNTLDYYQIEYVIQSPGNFTNSEIQELYNELITEGNKSLEDAYRVGATIEDLDIYDLGQALLTAEKSNIIQVFESLQCGSRNHIRSFVQSIESLNATYTPQYITTSEYDNIINGSHENCN